MFFLTHFHGDHMQGLHAKWRMGLLHCSEVTAQLLRWKFGVNSPLSRVVRPHRLHDPFDVFDRCSKLHITVTFIDANHCPGSVMIAFEGWPSGGVLHTGDFRWYEGLRKDPTLLRLRSHLDMLHFDNTCAHPAYQCLPDKRDSVRDLLSLLENHCRDDNIFLHSHGLGDEPVLHAIADSWLNTPRTCAFTSQKLLFTEAASQRYGEIMTTDSGFCKRCCERIDLRTITSAGPCVYVVPNAPAVQQLRSCHISGIEISCSTLWFARRAAMNAWSESPMRDTYGCWHVLFSMHSSLNEIADFQTWLRPRSSRGIARILCESDAELDRRQQARPPLNFDTVAGCTSAAASSSESVPAAPSVSQTRQELANFCLGLTGLYDGLNVLMDVPDGIKDLDPHVVARSRALRALRPSPTVLDSDCSSTETDEVSCRMGPGESMHSPSAPDGSGPEEHKKRRLDRPVRPSGPDQMWPPA